MKNIVRIACLAVLSLSIMLAPHIATAQSQTIAQGQTSGRQNVGPKQTQDMAAQINTLQDAIKATQQEIQDTQKKIQQVMDDIKQ
jgi:peptidoglycan hydrolase CwlO-like protein